MQLLEKTIYEFVKKQLIYRQQSKWHREHLYACTFISLLVGYFELKSLQVIFRAFFYQYLKLIKLRSNWYDNDMFRIKEFEIIWNWSRLFLKSIICHKYQMVGCPLCIHITWIQLYPTVTSVMIQWLGFLTTGRMKAQTQAGKWHTLQLHVRCLTLRLAQGLLNLV